MANGYDQYHACFSLEEPYETSSIRQRSLPSLIRHRRTTTLDTATMPKYHAPFLHLVNRSSPPASVQWRSGGVRAATNIQCIAVCMERSSREVRGNVDDGAVVARFSLDVSVGCGGRHSTLLDEYERLAFEAQLNRAILRRCYSEPISPARFVVQPSSADALRPAPREAEGEEPRHEPAPGSSWRLHEVVSRWLETLKPVFSWLRNAWEYRWEEQTTPRGPPTMPRVQLLDYLC